MLEGLKLSDMESATQKYLSLAKTTLFGKVNEVLNTKDSTINSSSPDKLLSKNKLGAEFGLFFRTYYIFI